VIIKFYALIIDVLKNSYAQLIIGSIKSMLFHLLIGFE
jgi:hypothetical protein